MNTYGAKSHVDSPQWTAMRRAQITLQNQLARAVRTIYADPTQPVARLVIKARRKP